MALLNRCVFTPVTGGLADFVVSNPVTGFMTPSLAGAVNGGTYHYVAASTDNQFWEIGLGTYSTSGPTLARTTVLYSSAGGPGGAKINFATIPNVAIDAISEDILGAKHYVDVVDLGADATGAVDSSTIIQNAINSLTKGGIVFFPTGTYIVASHLVMPTTVSVWLLGSGRGEGPSGTTIKATAAMTEVIQFGTVFFRGHKISDMTIDANNNASYCINAQQADEAVFENLLLYNATLINFRLGDGVHNTQENTVRNVRTDNPLNSVLANQPTYNIEVNGTNNHFTDVIAANAKTANWHLGANASGNKYLACHGYDFFAGAAQPVTNNFLIDGSGEQLIAPEADGSGAANFQINGFSNVIIGGQSQFQGLPAQIGVQFKTGTSGNTVIGTFFANSTIANCVVQAGTAGGPGNTAIGCGSGQGVVIQSYLESNASYSYQVPLTGFSIVCTNFSSDLILDPAGTLATGTITMPNFPADGQIQRVASTQTVTTLTVSPAGGQSIKNAPTTIAAGGAFTYRYRLANTTWYKVA